MLLKLNQRIQGIVAWVVITLIALTFTLFGVEYYMQARQVSDVEVTVNNEPITKQSYEVSYRRVRQQREFEQISAAKESAVKKQILQDMIFNVITVQSARKDGFLVTGSQADNAIVNIPQFQQDGQFSEDRYRQALNAALYTPESFRNQVSQGMLLNQERFAFIGTAFALPNEINQFVKLYMQTRDYEFVIIPKDQFITKVQVTQPEIANYYIQHKQDFIEPEKISIDYVKLSVDDVKKSISIQDQDVERYYQENASNYSIPARWRVKKISFEIPANASEDEKADIVKRVHQVYSELKQHPERFDEEAGNANTQATAPLKSKPKLNRANLNARDWIVAGTTSFDSVLSSLRSPGQISEPYKSDSGYVLFKLVDFQQSKTKPFSAVKGEIKAQLTSEAVQAKFSQQLEQLTDLSYQTPDSLSTVAETLKLPMMKSDLFTHDGGSDPLTRNKQLINAAFSHDVLELGNNSEPIQFDNDNVIVLRIRQHLPSEQRKLAEVEGVIRERLKLYQASLAAKDLGVKILAISDQKQESALLNQHHLSWHAVNDAARDTDQSDPLITELAFNIPQINNRSGRALDDGNYAIVRLKLLKEGQYQTLDNEQQDSLIQQIQASYGAMDYDLYVSGLVNRAQIVR